MDIDIDYSGKTIGKYSLIEKIGKGNFGAVYKARDIILKTEKAIKILNVSDPRRAHELFTEAEIPYKCQHVNIVRINSGEMASYEGEIHFIIDMELINGGSVEKLLSKGALSVVDSLLYMKHILFGIQHSHSNGIIHRDIKPANILIDNGIPKISDFGLATTLNSLIRPWKWYCTHAAPEAYLSSTATIATDIFAAGMTMYRMTNRIDDWDSLLGSIRNVNDHIRSGKLIDKLPFRPFVPKPMIRIIRRACKSDPSHRYSSASEYRNDIERLKPYYDWRPLDEWTWSGISRDNPDKYISIEPRRNRIDVVVKNGNRKSSADSRTYIGRHEAESYFMEYISTTTLH